jgi:hypothetical protein
LIREHCLIDNSFTGAGVQELFADSFQHRVFLRVSTFAGFNCEFSHNNENGISIRALTNFFLGGVKSECKGNFLRGMYGVVGNRFLSGASIRLGAMVRANFCSNNNDNDSYSNTIYVDRDLHRPNEREVHIEKNKKPLGIRLSKKFVIAAVQEGGIGDKYGLLVGQHIFAIDGELCFNPDRLLEHIKRSKFTLTIRQ